MRLPESDLFARVSQARSRVQEDGGIFRRFREKYQLDDIEYWLAIRFRYFPGSATPADFLTFGPYTSISKYLDALGKLTEKKLVDGAGETRYRLADSTRKAIADTYAEYFARVARLDVLDDGDLDALYTLIDRVYTAALRQSEVPAPILSAAHSTLPDIESPWVQLERRIAGLVIFRDDAHVAAWRDAGFTGPGVEVSTILFNAPGGLTDTELRAAAHRLDDKDFKSALAALHSGGEAMYREERYMLTRSGRAARQEIENVTNRNYARPFAAIDDDQLDKMIGLLDKLAAQS